MIRGLSIALCLALAVAAAPASAKKGKRKPARLGPVVTATATGPLAGPMSLESTAVATCPAGTKVVGGGFSAPFSATSAMLVRESFKSSATSWTVTGRAVNASGAPTATALCRRIPKAAKVSIRTVSQTVSAAPMFGIGTAEALCPGGTKPIGGGFLTQAGTDPSDVVVAMRNLATPTGWKVSGLNGDGTDPHAVTAQAYCATRVKKLINPATSATPSLSQATRPAVTSPACPAPKGGKKGKKKKRKKAAIRLTGGGWDFGEPTPAGPIPVATQSGPAGNAWQVAIGDAVAIDGSLPVSVQAVCF